MVALDLVTLGYACRPAPRRRQDRARAKCLERLLWDMRERAVEDMVVESREAHNDAEDRRTIVRSQRAGAAPKVLAYRFERPLAEPGLWLADAAAGAVATAVADGEGRYLDVLGRAACVAEVSL